MDLRRKNQWQGDKSGDDCQNFGEIRVARSKAVEITVTIGPEI